MYNSFNYVRIDIIIVETKQLIYWTLNFFDHYQYKQVDEHSGEEETCPSVEE